MVQFKGFLSLQFADRSSRRRKAKRTFQRKNCGKYKQGSNEYTCAEQGVIEFI